MKRLIEKELIQWQKQKNRMPLIIRGARQIGKSYIIEKFGKNNFDGVVTVNFELLPKLKSIFLDLDPHKIVAALELSLGIPIHPGKTLLFFDEIQECPEAIMALRYFKEQLPALHVIAAGSLLEFALQAKNFRMPVGRIQYLYMKPLSFKEFLMALGQDQLKNYIEEIHWNTEIVTIVHEKLLDYVRQYFLLGGMPAVIQDYIENNSLLSARRIQHSILTTYRNDFGKYENVAKHKYLEMLFEKSPQMITQQFRYSEVSRDVQSRDIKDALANLKKAGLIYQNYSTNATGLPLKALINEKRFKLLFLDIGLVSAAMDHDAQLMMEKELLLINRGTLSEQFVGQELIANQDYYFEPEIFYWSRDARGSQAEVDYIINMGSNIIPIEVKSGSTGHMRSLQLFMSEHQSDAGVKISPSPFMNHNKIVSIPFYLVSEIKRLLA